MQTAHVLDIDPLDRLAARIREQEAVVAVVGLGYVGLPLLVGIHGAGFPVIGVDVDETKIAELVARRSHIVDILDSEIASMDKATFTAVPEALRGADVIVLCLPTPLTDGAPDLTMVLTAAEDVARYLTPRHTGRAGVHHVSRHHRGAPAAHPGAVGLAGRASTSRWATHPSASTRATASAAWRPRRRSSPASPSDAASSPPHSTGGSCTRW